MAETRTKSGGRRGGDIGATGPGAGGGGTLAAWLQCSLVIAVSAVTFTIFYFPNVRDRWAFGKADDPNIKWWQKSIIYQVYPRSFKDTNGDGVGDIPGITDQLDYFEYLGVQALWISPVYKSPMVDFGYDVSDFTDIDPLFGTMNDFRKLISNAHDRDIRIIMDFIPNHTSDKHPWFEASRKSRTGKYAGYYVWADGLKLPNGTVEPPNNWVGVFGGSMWTWEERRQQFYLHQFTKEQPDLNYQNPAVHQEILAAFEFWLTEGVDGFRVDAVRHVYETTDLSLNEPVSNRPNTTPDQYEYYDHPYTVNQPETHAVVRTWRDLFDKFETKTGKDIFMVIEILDEAKNILPYYHSGATFPFNFNLQFLNASCDGFCVRYLVDSWLAGMPEGKWANWVLGSHDVPRISAKLDTRNVNALNMLLLLLPGTPTTYYGEELGLLEIDVSYQDTQDPFGKNFGPERYKEVSRDPVRAPMQWSRDRNAGFSTAQKTWLPVHPDYLTNNVETQKSDPSGEAPLQLYRKLAFLRRQEALLQGNFDYAVVNKNIFSFIRYLDNEPSYLVALNLGRETSTDNYRQLHGLLPEARGGVIPVRGYVVHTTGNLQNKGHKPEETVFFEKITLQPSEGIVVRYFPYIPK